MLYPHSNFTSTLTPNFADSTQTQNIIDESSLHIMFRQDVRPGDYNAYTMLTRKSVGVVTKLD